MRYRFAWILGLGLLPMTVGQVSADNAVEIPVAQQQPNVAMPGAEKIVLLVRNSLITLNDALQSGNFTVLRDRGAPGFREANSAARLSQIFAKLQAQKIDLAAVSVIAPKLTQQPTLDQEKGMLDLKGYFPGQPVQINFELLYQAVKRSVAPVRDCGATRSAADGRAERTGLGIDCCQKEEVEVSKIRMGRTS